VVAGALLDLGQLRQLAESVDLEIESMSRFTSPHQALPRTHLLSNGEYSVMLTVAGSGYSRWRDIAVTRWREDPTCDPFGCYIYLRDVVDGEVWSAGYSRSPGRPSRPCSSRRAQITRHDGSISPSPKSWCRPTTMRKSVGCLTNRERLGNRN
jgi:cyclic beta-1,2-glucan synthetase